MWRGLGSESGFGRIGGVEGAFRKRWGGIGEMEGECVKRVGGVEEWGLDVGWKVFVLLLVFVLRGCLESNIGS